MRTVEKLVSADEQAGMSVEFVENKRPPRIFETLRLVGSIVILGVVVYIIVTQWH